MDTKRRSAAAIFYQNCLHVLGGICLSEIKLVEKYDPETKKWTDFPSMCEPRAVHAVAVLNEKLYACGGYGKSSVEVYDPSKKSWKLVASMKKKRFHFVLVAHEGKLFAIGGRHDKDGMVEVYDPSKDEWQMDHELSLGLQIHYPSGGWIPALL